MAKPNFAVSLRGECWFEKDLGELGGNASSQRKILPDKNGSRVKHTVFFSNAAPEFEAHYPNDDESGFIISGEFRLTPEGGEPVELGPGSSFYCPRGTRYMLETLKDGSSMFCVFSPVPGGLKVDSK